MAFSKAYVPSRALLRALSRPVPPRCPFARPPTAQFARFKRTRAAKAAKAVTSDEAARFRPEFTRRDFEKELAAVQEQMERQKSAPDDEYERDRPLTDKELENPDLPAIRWYEQAPDGAQRLVRETVTAEDRKRDRDMAWMIEESWSDPEYDDSTLNRALLDDLAKDPNFADLTEGLMEIKKIIMSKEEIKAAEEQAAKEAEPESKQFEQDMHMEAQRLLQDLIDDPDIGDAKEELQQLQAKLSTITDIEDPAFQTELNATMAKLNDNDKLQKKMAAMADEATDLDVEQEWQKFEKDMEALLEDDDEDDNDDPFDVETPEGIRKVETLMAEVRDMLKTINDDPKLQAELDVLLGEKPEESDEPELDEDALVEKLNSMVDAPSQGHLILNGTIEETHNLPATTARAGNAIEPSRVADANEPDEYDTLPEDLKSKVDHMMQDPKIIEKLMFIQNLIAEEQQKAAELIAIKHETAPDPETLPDSRTATLQERTEIARRDPEHMAAMAGLRVTLPPPFNISPALRHFNQSIELAYIGANDDVRRILWRAYMKARSLPSFLESLSDDAWDIMYYSQAVKWQSNQNREHHLRVVLGDLRGLGRDGPPTHPSTLVNGSDERNLEV